MVLERVSAQKIRKSGGAKKLYTYNVNSASRPNVAGAGDCGKNAASIDSAHSRSQSNPFI